MHVVNISLSPSVLDKDSVTARRLSKYGRVTTEYTVLVPFIKDKEVRLADNVLVCGVGGKNKIIKLLRIYKKVKTLIKSNRCDVLSTDPYFFGLLGVYFSRRFGVGFEVCALGFEKFTWLRKQIARFVCTNADSIRVNSPYLVQFVKEKLYISGEKVHLVPIYVDVETIGLQGNKNANEQKIYTEQVTQFKKLYGTNFNFLAVNRLVPAKNISLQLKAMAGLVKIHPEVFLHILGDGPLENDLRLEIKKLGLEKNVKLHGHVFGVALGAMYASCDCFLLTSDNEGWGMVTVEALTASLPIIMTDVGSAGELIIDGKSGMVIPVDDKNALVRAMKIMVEDKNKRHQLIQGGAEALHSLLSLTEILALYKASWTYTLKK